MSVENECSKSYLRKVERKQRRVQAKISEEIGIKFSETPTTVMLAIISSSMH